MANPDKIERKWYVVDADGCTKNSAPSPAMPFATPAMSPHSGIICS